jgi:biotin carboxyl carrier protein
MLYHVTIGARTLRVELDGDSIRVDDVEIPHTDLATLPGTPVRHLIGGGRSTTVIARRDEGGWELQVDGWPVRAEVMDERTRAIQAMTGQTAGATGPKPVRAPMPGLVVRVEVALGDTVRAGQPMKMENELKAESGGVVARVLVAAGQAVRKGDVLMEFEPQPS